MASWKTPGCGIFLLLFFTVQGFAQPLRNHSVKPLSQGTVHDFTHCQADEQREWTLSNDPVAAARHHAYETIFLQSQRLSSPNSRNTTLTVPVVVHIIHNNSLENIPASQALTAVSQLNAAFANAGNYAVADGTPTDIEFCLAQRDPQGLPTTGINRVQSPLTVFTRETEDAQLKALSQWPSDQYLNVWVVRDVISNTAGPNVAGYATFPFLHGDPTDGVVIEFSYFGTTTNSNKAFVHEVGHYLGLYHTFEGGCRNDDCQVDGDRVCDTPPDGSTATVTGYVNSCQTDGDDLSASNPFRPATAGGLGDQPDPYDNYMDYGGLNILARFTPGQSDRMRGQLQQFRASLLQNFACVSPCLTQVTADFLPSADTVPIGTTVNFLNQSGGASSYLWSVNGTANGNALNSSYTFNQTGFYTVRLEAGNGQSGCGDAVEKTILVRCDAQAAFGLSKTELLPGESLTLTSAAQNANQVEWLFNGNPVGTQPVVTTQFTQPGGIGVQLVATSPQCQDSSAVQFVQVTRCGVDMHALNWVFGDSASMKMSTDSAVNTTGTVAGTYEGCASISDEQGNLLFYSNGSTVFDRANFPMTNGTGLIGNKSASQGVVIVPFPNQPFKYILFTSDAVENTFFQGLRYSVIDMSVSNGLGDVDPAQKNVMMGTFKCEMVAAVQHDNGRDFWLVTHEAFNNNFNSFLITPNGVASTPVVTPIGPSMMLPTGAFKVSPNREKVAISMNEIGVRSMAVLDFDAATGRFDNPFYVPIDPTRQVYGIEWSPDNSKIYFSTLYDLFQIDMTQPTPQDIINSKDTLYASPALDMLGMQRAVNGKIYVSAGQIPKLHVIASPNEKGANCDFQFQGYDLQGSVSLWGLPNFYISKAGEIDFVEVDGPDEICAQAPGALYTATRTKPNQTIQWGTLGGASLLPLQTDSITAAQFSGSGLAGIVAERRSACGISRDTQWVNVLAAPTSILPADTSVCPASLFPLTASNDTAVTYLWNTGSTMPTIFPSQGGSYAVRMENTAGCITRDTVDVATLAPSVPPVDLGMDTAICEGKVMRLDAFVGNAYAYRWQDGSQLPTLTTTGPGAYSVAVTDICGFARYDTIVVRDTNTVWMDLGPDEEICGPKVLTVGADYSSVLWDDSSTSGSRPITQPGTYWVEVTSVGGCIARDTVTYLPCTTVGTEDALLGLELRVYPNPTLGPVNVELAGLPVGANALVTVVDAQGRTVRHQSSDDAGLGQGERLDLGGLGSGIYHIVVQSEGHTWQQRLQVGH